MERRGGLRGPSAVRARQELPGQSAMSPMWRSLSGCAGRDPCRPLFWRSVKRRDESRCRLSTMSPAAQGRSAAPREVGILIPRPILRSFRSARDPRKTSQGRRLKTPSRTLRDFAEAYRPKPWRPVPTRERQADFADPMPVGSRQDRSVRPPRDRRRPRRAALRLQSHFAEAHAALGKIQK